MSTTLTYPLPWTELDPAWMRAAAAKVAAQLPGTTVDWREETIAEATAFFMVPAAQVRIFDRLSGDAEYRTRDPDRNRRNFTSLAFQRPWFCLLHSHERRWTLGVIRGDEGLGRRDADGRVPGT